MATSRALPHPPRRVVVGAVGLAAVTLVTLLVLQACTGPRAEEPPPTAVVDRGQVATLVSASGTLVAVSEQNLGFPDGGELVEVLVAVGDRVEPGQVLARLDDFALGRTRDQSQARLDQARADLDKIVNGNSVESAEESLEAARSILDATVESAGATDESNEESVNQAERQLDFDRDALEEAEADLAEAEDACDAEGGAESSSADGTTADDAATDDTTNDGTTNDGTTNDGTATGDAADGTTDDATVQEASTTGGSDSSSGGSSACDQVTTAESDVRSAERTVLTSESALSTAQQQERTGEASGQVSIANAEQSVTTAEGNLAAARSDRPADTGAQEAAVAEAEAALALAQRDVDDTVLVAPLGGTVAELNGVVGEFVAAASGTTALAPGSLAALPESTDATAAGGTGAAPFLRLEDVDSFQLVVPFEESEAARVGVDQQVQVSVDAVPDLEQTGTVLAISPTADTTSGIVNYYTTVVLPGTDPRLRNGQTAQAGVVVESAENVLRVPATAVRVTADGSREVDVAGPDGTPVATPFVPGLLGDEFVEVRSGLRDGQEVLLPQAEVAPQQGGGPPG